MGHFATGDLPGGLILDQPGASKAIGSNGGLAVELLIGIIVTFLVAALVIYIVSRLNLGLTVKSFGTAFALAVLIAITGGIVGWLFGLFDIDFNGLIGAIIILIVAAIVLMFSASLLPGVKIYGFGGAILAAIAIGIISGIINWLLGLLGIA